MEVYGARKWYLQYTVGEDSIMLNWDKISFKNPKYTRFKDSKGNKLIDLEVYIGESWLPFTLNPEDSSARFNTALLYNKVVAGTVATPSQSELDAGLAIDIRDLRDRKLKNEVDPIVTNPLRWEDLSTSKQNEWKAYRTALLAVPQQSGFPNTITWPTKPE